MTELRFVLKLAIFVFLAFYQSDAGNSDFMLYDIAKEQFSGRATVDSQISKTQSYWTADRMRAAKPMDQQKGSGISPSGTTTTTPLKRILSGGDKFIAIEPTRSNDSVVKGRLISPQNQFVRTVGKVFFTTRFGNAQCSASVVTAPSCTLIVTTAYCVFDLSGRVWYTNWVFVPAYDDGAAPLGIWPAKYFLTLTAFTSSSASYPAWNSDVAFVVLHPVSSRRVAQLTGSQGIAFNAPRYQLTYSLGYPANIASGIIMSACISRPIAPTCFTSGYAGQALRCGMQQGSGGGPWIINMNAELGLGQVVSVNSVICGSSQYMLHGPYFDYNIYLAYNAIKSVI